MNDLHGRLKELDHLDIPDLSAEIDRRVHTIRSASSQPLGSPTGRLGRGPLLTLGTVAAVLLVAVASLLLAGRIGEGPTDSVTPWEQFRATYNLERLSHVISDEAVFVGAFNRTYEGLESCEQAYAAAIEGQEGYRSVEWDDEVTDRPGVDYDRFVAQEAASLEWLGQNDCPEAPFPGIG